MMPEFAPGEIIVINAEHNLIEDRSKIQRFATPDPTGSQIVPIPMNQEEVFEEADSVIKNETKLKSLNPMVKSF